MQLFLPTIVLRHRLENLKKCSLKGLETRPDFIFYSYPKDDLSKVDLSNYILLALDAPPLTYADADQGIFILDATWRYSKKMLLSLPQNSKFSMRSIPPQFRTAYPRRQQDCSHPDQGLASIEAIYIAYTIFRRKTDQLIDNYFWKDQFLEKNRKYLDYNV
jgi:pre-rRNA-processing protein TSR3